MTFLTTSALDTFDRPDANNLGDKYATAPGYDTLFILSSAAAMGASATLNIYRRRWSVNQQVWVRLHTIDSNVAAIYLAFRLNSVTPTDGYLCILRPEFGVWMARLYRYATMAEIGTSIALGVANLLPGDYVGINAQGAYYTLWFYPAWGAPTNMGQWSDAGVLQQGFIGLGGEHVGCV